MSSLEEEFKKEQIENIIKEADDLVKAHMETDIELSAKYPTLFMNEISKYKEKLREFKSEINKRVKKLEGLCHYDYDPIAQRAKFSRQQNS